MLVLTINSGSSSVKYQLINTSTQKALCRGIVERIGIDGTKLKHKTAEGKKFEKIDPEITNHQTAIGKILEILVDTQNGVIDSLSKIESVGHRLVHAGEKFKHSVLITNEVMSKLHECIEFAPLHNPHNIKGVEASLENLAGLPNVGVFDTTFHADIPDYAYTYGIPYEYYRKHGIRRYGFHGTSHYYVSRRAAEILGRDVSELKMISCHLGNGSSITAIQGGVSIDTTMGFTPLEGLVMGTRCGDIDPGVIFNIASRENMTVDEACDFFNKKCGVLGISEMTSDMREIEEAAEAGNYNAKLALEVYNYRIKKYIGSYFGILNGADVIVFTGGVGENSDITRAAAVGDMDQLGIVIDPERNAATRSKEAIISTPDSPVTLMVIPTNEELVIAMETERIIRESK